MSSNLETINSVIPWNEFNTKYPADTILSQGTYGKVYSVKNNNDVVVKCSKFNDIITDINILSQISHPNIISIINTSIDPRTGSTVIAQPRGQDILEYLKFHKNKIPQFFCELLCAVDFLHKENIAHCDIKTTNIVVIDHHPVLIDFGLSQIGFRCDNNVFYNGHSGTLTFSSPYEARDFKTIKTDIFSLGKTFEALYQERGVYNSSFALQTGNKDLTDLLTVLLSENPPSITDILKMSYFSLNNTKCSIGYRIGEVVTRQTKKQIGDVNDKMYYILVGWILEVSGDLDVDIRALFLSLHNIHRTINIFEDIQKYKRTDLILFGITNLYLATCIYQGVTMERRTFKQFLDIDDSEPHTEEQGYSMIYNILKATDGIIYTQTLWDLVTKSTELVQALKSSLFYEYTFTPRKVDEISCNKYLSARKFVNKLGGTFTYDKIMALLKNPPKIKQEELDKMVIKVNNNEKLPLTLFFDPDDTISLAVLYNNREKLKKDVGFTNEIVSKILKSVYGGIYDIVLGKDKINLLKPYDVKFWLINVYTSSIDELKTYIKNMY